MSSRIISFRISIHSAIHCNFEGTPILKGLNRLDLYGLLGFEALYVVALGLGGLFERNVCGVNIPAHVQHALKINLAM
jgi:hypothetical protein